MKRSVLLLLGLCFMIALGYIIWPDQSSNVEEIVATDYAQPQIDTNVVEPEITPKRTVASLPPKPASQNKRDWIGQKDAILSQGKIRFKNKPKKDWAKKLEASLRRGLPENTKLEIKPERDVVLINGLVGTNAQQVVVVFKAPLKYNSYRAMVDSESGKILRTWDHTVHETFGRRKVGLTAFPLEQSEN